MVPTRFIWSLTLLAALGGHPFGYDTSTIGAALKCVEVFEEQAARGGSITGQRLRDGLPGRRAG